MKTLVCKRFALLLAVALAASSVVLGCGRSTPAAIVVYLRDDAANQDVDRMMRELNADDRVADCRLNSQNVTPSQEQAGRQATPTPGPDSSPWSEEWLVVTLARDVDRESFDSLVATIEEYPGFKRWSQVSD